MPISNGEQVDATVTNRAKMDREQDTDTVGKVALNNFATDAASGTNTTNVQRDINAVKNFIGQSANVGITSVPGFTNNTYGSVGDNVRQRIDAIASATQTNSTDITSVTNDATDLRTLSGTADGSTDLGTFTGVTIADNRNIKQALQDLETEVETRIDSTEKGAANGVATLDGSGLIPSSQLPLSVMEFKGNWNASTNSPSLVDGTGSSGDTYRVSADGTQNLGSGSISYTVGDWVYYTGTIWQRGDLVDAVTSVNSQTGAVTLTTTNISEGTNLYYTDARVLTKINATSIDALSDVDTTTSPPTNTQVLAYNTGSSKWEPANAATNAATGTGARNYMETNPGAESVITGYVAYKDAAGTRPVDGTGGSPTATVTRTTSTPLRGSGSILFTKTAANLQGEGFSYDFTIDDADKMSLQRLSFDWYPDSGTYAGGSPTTDSDVIVYVYDVTNSTLIEPIPFKLDGTGTTNRYKFTGVFSTTTSTSYRLIFHIATTSASAYTLKFDNFILGAMPSAALGPVTTQYDTATFTGGFTSNTTYTGVIRRDGDQLQGRVKIAFSGAPNSTTFTLNMPTGYTIDTAKLPATSSQVGYALANDSGTGHVGNAYVFSNSLKVIGDDGAGDWTQAVPFTFGASDYIEIDFSVPIVGWGSSSTIGSDAGLTPMFAKYNFSASSGNPSIASAATEVMDYDTKVVDQGGLVTTGTGWKATFPYAGVMIVSASAHLDNMVTAKVMDLRVFKNGSLYHAGNRTGTGSTDTHGSQAVTLVYGVAGDTVDFRCFNGDAATRSLTTTSGFCTASIWMLPFSALVQATEFVVAKYSTSAAPSIANTGTTRIDFATKSFDSHGLVTTGASWVFTANKAGKYRISSIVKFTSSTYAAGNRAEMSVLKNNSLDTVLDHDVVEVAASRDLVLQGSSVLSLVAGDTLQVNLANNRTAGATSLTSSATENQIVITYEGL